MRQNLINHLTLFNAGNDFYFTLTTFAGCDVNVVLSQKILDTAKVPAF